ncbi:MAG TPA: hypothetical protein VI731_02310 [Bacteroidia bacterium]|nr:hypothetical protein [Bacteroidia bacterium]
MKSLIALLTVCAVFIFSSCVRNDVAKVVVHGKWEVSSYTSNGNVDETAGFAGWTLNFEKNNTLTISSGSGEVKGNWYKAAGTYDQNLLFVLPVGSTWEKLNANWVVTDKDRKNIWMRTEDPHPDAKLVLKRK